MAIRPPRAIRRRRRSRIVSDLVLIGIVATAVLLFVLRSLLSLLGIESWTAAWRLVNLPTGVLVEQLERVEAMRQTPAGDLSLATIVLTVATWLIALLVLGTLANRRD